MKPVLSFVLSVTLLSVVLFAADKSKKGRIAPGDKVEFDFGGPVQGEVIEIGTNGWITAKINKNGLEMTPTLPPDKFKLIAKKGDKENDKVKGAKKETGSKLRTWTDKTGKFKVKAKFVELKDGDVVLETDEGKSVTLALDKLSKDDQKVALDLAKEADENPFKAADENPFDAGSKKSGDDSNADGGDADEMTDVDWSQLETLTPGETSQWSFTPDAQPQLDKPLWSKPIILASTLKGKGAGGQLNFFENIDGLLFDRAQGRAYAVP